MTPEPNAQPQADDVLTVENFFAPKQHTANGVNPNAPTGDAYFDMITGKGPKETDPGKRRMPRLKRP